MNDNFIKVTMIFIREIHFSTLVQNCYGSTSVQKDPQSAHHTGVWVTGGRCRWCDMLQLLLLLPRCLVIRVTGSVRYTKYFVVWTFYHSLCKNGWTDRRQSLKPTPIHAKCSLVVVFALHLGHFFINTKTSLRVQRHPQTALVNPYEFIKIL